MRLDILLITYNQAQYIAQALDGVMMQRVNSDVEVRVIVADDASTDDTLATIRSYEAQSPFPFVYLPTEVNMGHINNYKRAFAACTSDYVCVLEGDDWWTSPYHLQNHVMCLSEHQECSMSVNKLIFYFQDKKIFCLRENLREGDICYVNTQDHILQNRVDNHSACCYRTKLLKQVPDSIFGETFDDWVLGIYMAQYGFIAQLGVATSVYRIHSHGVWSGLGMNYQNEMVLNNIARADEIFDGIYHDWFEEAKRIVIQRIAPAKKHKLREYLPEWLLNLYHGIVPPILRHKL